MEHMHNVIDADVSFIIDAMHGKIKSESKKLTLREGAHNSERYSFELPRYIEGHDMSLCNKVEVHYLNTSTKKKDTFATGKYTVEDMRIAPDDESKVIFSWLISKNATKYAGALSFCVKFKCIEDDIETYSWNTEIFAEIRISDGINADESFEFEYVDIIEQWKKAVISQFSAEIDDLGETLKTELSEWEELETGKIRGEMTAYSAQWNQALSVERARIDNIVALPEGSTTGDAELLDVRIGVNGENYSCAGDAVRGQFSTAFNDQKLLAGKGKTTLAPFAGWKVGGLTAAQPVANKNRIMSTNIMHFDRTIKIKVEGGFKFGIHCVTADGVFMSDSGWQHNGYDVEAGTYFKMVIARIEEDFTETANITEFSNAVTTDSFFIYEVKNLSADVERINDTLQIVSGLHIIDIKGNYYTSGGTGAPQNRIHAEDIICDGGAIVEYCGQVGELLYGVDLYTNDGNRTLISQSGWMKVNENPIFKVEQKCLVHISISKVDMTSFSDLSEMDGLFTVSLFDKVKDQKEYTNVKHGKCWLSSAHRGFAQGALKENSLAAYYNAYLNGADMIETDARFTSDGVLIVNHDATATGIDASGKTITYTVAETPASVICDLILSDDKKWGTQKIPTLEQVLHLAYNTGLIVNIDLKDGINSAEAVAKLVLKHGMQGRVIYALNGAGMDGINKILAIDNDARFIDIVGRYTGVQDVLADSGKRCFAYTDDISEASVNIIRESGYMLSLIGLNSNNFEAAMTYHPDMCEYLHTSDFRAIEDAYFENLQLY